MDKKNRLSDAVYNEVKKMEPRQVAKFRKALKREIPKVIQKCAQEAKNDNGNSK